MEKQIILLNGPSSSGKSTLSKNLQNLLKEKFNLRYYIVSIDDFMKLATNETIYEDDVYEISADMNNKALEVLNSYDGVIIDHVITSERIFNELIEALSLYPIFKVQVECPLDVLIKREIERNNRCIGSAESSYTYLYPKDNYDFTVNTHLDTSANCAIKILENLF
ncbi:MAG: hypothetical protein E7564_02755 [Ruminococcaceae bacterium]|nr:hypothetical protein [Oscillospiraceae bacterium]